MKFQQQQNVGAVHGGLCINFKDDMQHREAFHIFCSEEQGPGPAGSAHGQVGRRVLPRPGGAKEGGPGLHQAAGYQRGDAEPSNG